MRPIDPVALFDYTGALLRSEGEPPPRDADLDLLLRLLGEQLAGDGEELDPLTLASLHDGLVSEAERDDLQGRIDASPTMLRQSIELAAVLAAYEDDAGPRIEAPPVDPDAIVDALESRSTMAPVVDLAERRRWKRSSWVAAAASLAALLLLGVFLLVPRPQLPGDLGVVALAPESRTLRSSGWQVGETLELTASVEPDVSWAVVAVAGTTADQPVRVWVAQTEAQGADSDTSEPGRVLFREQLAPPAGQRAYLVVASRRPLVDLPALVTDWEAELRQPHRQPDGFARDLQAIVDAEAGQRRWRVSKVVPVAVAEPQGF